LTALVANVSSAFAVPQSKAAQARAVKADIERLDEEVEVASDRYQEAKAKHAKLTAQRRKVAARYKKVTKRMDVVQEHLNTRAGSMYRRGSAGFLEVLLGADSFEDFATTWDLLRDLNEDDANAIVELRQLRAEAKKARDELAAKEKAAAKQAAAMNRGGRGAGTRSSFRLMDQRVGEAVPAADSSSAE